MTCCLSDDSKVVIIDSLATKREIAEMDMVLIVSNINRRRKEFKDLIMKRELQNGRISFEEESRIEKLNQMIPDLNSNLDLKMKYKDSIIRAIQEISECKCNRPMQL